MTDELIHRPNNKRIIMTSSSINVRLYIALLLAVFSLFVNRANAQELRTPESLVVTEGDFVLNDILRPGFAVTTFADSKVVLKSLKDYLKKEYALKVSAGRDFLEGEDLFTTKLSDKHFSLYAEVSENQLIVWMAFGTDVYATSATFSTEATKISTLEKQFIKSFYEGFIAEEIAVAQKSVDQSMKTLEKESKALNSEKSNLEKNQKKIDKAKKEEAKIADKMKDLEAQRVDNVADIAKLDANSKDIEVKIKTAEEAVVSFKEDMDLKQKNRDRLKSQLTKIRAL